MARLTRLCIPGWPHLLVQRGQQGQAVFVDDEDRSAFRSFMVEAAPVHGVRIHAYGMLSDEFRLVATPLSETALGRLMQAIGRRYVAQFNRRHARRGGLWEGRFRSTVVEPEPHLLACMQFAEGWAAGGALHVSDMLATSAPHHIGAKTDSAITDPTPFWALGNTPFDREAAYRLRLEQGLTDREIREILSAVQSGWPLGSAAFVEKLSGFTDRRLAPKPRGRRPKVDTNRSVPN